MSTAIANSPQPRQIGAYSSVGSGAGIAGFTSGAYQIAVSDDPMTSAQDSSAPRKFTIPLALSTYSFVTKYPGAASFNVPGCLLAKIFLGKVRVPWSAISPGKSGYIEPVARLDKSGTTELISQYFLSQGCNWPAALKNSQASWGWSGVTYKTGSGGVGSYVQGHKFSIGYVQSGVASTYGLTLLKIQNRANDYVRATKADPAQSIPRILPSPGVSWSSVTLINTIGVQTYPIVFFEYAFARVKYPSTGNGKIAKVFLTYSQGTKFSGLLGHYFFYQLPSKVTTPSKII